MSETSPIAQSAKVELWIVQWTSTVASEQLRESIPEHLGYILDLERANKVFGSGPLFAPEGPDVGAGLTILRVASREEAEALAAADPLAAAGLRTFEIRRWILVEGSMGIKVRFSDSTFIVE
ncbi:YciI family protein [Salinibacterium sp. NK8237]|uniref:YciI family protein n=1 Tax=Salinibacterium sp. NK8237 TaxID=2792038 RepID=UPI0018CF61B6|nr:YciI family protein [Salinibacterium sp. NK8237]MBH0130094.1 hypothetical protein [Salinibacterium sp. NK8237]